MHNYILYLIIIENEVLSEKAKERGNEFFKKKQYQAAIDAYTGDCTTYQQHNYLLLLDLDNILLLLDSMYIIVQHNTIIYKHMFF